MVGARLTLEQPARAEHTHPGFTVSELKPAEPDKASVVIATCGVGSRVRPGETFDEQQQLGPLHRVAGLEPSRRRDRHSAVTPSPFRRRLNRDGEGTSAKWQSGRRLLEPVRPEDVLLGARVDVFVLLRVRRPLGRVVLAHAAGAPCRADGELGGGLAGRRERERGERRKEDRREVEGDGEGEGDGEREGQLRRERERKRERKREREGPLQRERAREPERARRKEDRREGGSAGPADSASSTASWREEESERERESEFT